MSKIIKSGKECRNGMFSGMERLYDIVSKTLGPGGRNIAIVDGFGNLKVTKDGVTVARSMSFDDEVEECGAKLLKEAAQKTCDESGDGTTTTIVLAYNLIRECKKALSNKAQKTTVTDMRNSLNASAAFAVEKMKELAVPCVSEKDMHDVALISANGDEEIARLVTEAVMKATKDGSVSIEGSQVGHSYVETISGMNFERGYESDFFINDKDMRVCSFESANVVIMRGKIDSILDIAEIIDPLVALKRPILFMADDYSVDVVSALAMNNVRSPEINVCAVKLPAFGQQRDLMVEDICLLLGCKPINTAQYSFKDFDPEIHVGSCDRIVVSKTSTTIAGGDGDQNILMEHIENLREEINHEEDNDKVARLKERLVKLAGGISIIHVWASSDTEMNEIKDRVDDAVCAVRSAMMEGVVPGCGMAYLHARSCLAGITIGDKILQSVLDCVSRMVMDNAEIPYEEGMEKVAKDYSEAPSVIDPFKSVRIALMNAVSAACMFLTTEGCVIEKA